mgnify:CR=1 FL=1
MSGIIQHLFLCLCRRSFHIYDEKGIRENAKALKEAFAWNPGYREFFAVKATPNPFLIDILRPQRINTMGLSSSFKILIAASVNCSQPIPLWELA